MDDFLRFFDEKAKDFPMHLDIHYSKITDWEISVYKKGCATDYPDSYHIGEDAIIVSEQDCDVELAFARAQVALKEWLMEYEGGY